MGTYDVGDLVRLTCTFRDFEEELAEPTAVVCQVLDPSGNTDTVAASSDSTGVYTADVPVDESGTWRYRFEGTGALVAAVEGAFVVRRSYFE